MCILNTTDRVWVGVWYMNGWMGGRANIAAQVWMFGWVNDILSDSVGGRANKTVGLLVWVCGPITPYVDGWVVKY